jgi:hypothetical protein
MNVLNRLWYDLAKETTPDIKSQWFKHAVMTVTQNKGRRRKRKTNLASVPYMKKALIEADDKKWVKLGYRLAFFENYFRTDGGKQKLADTETELRDDFMKFLDMCQPASLPIGLDGKHSLDLLVHDVIPFTDTVAFFACMDKDIDTIKASLEKEGCALNANNAGSDGTVYRYEITSPQLPHLIIILTVYQFNETDELFYDRSDQGTNQGYAHMEKLVDISYEGREIRTLPPSYHIQQMLFYWASLPSGKDDRFKEEYTALMEKYYPDVNVLTDPLFSYIPEHVRTQQDDRDLFRDEDTDQD